MERKEMLQTIYRQSEIKYKKRKYILRMISDDCICKYILPYFVTSEWKTDTSNYKYEKAKLEALRDDMLTYKVHGCFQFKWRANRRFNKSMKKLNLKEVKVKK